MVVHATEEGVEKKESRSIHCMDVFPWNHFYVLYNSGWSLLFLFFDFCCLQFERLSLVGIASVMLSDYLEVLIVEL